MTSTLEGRNTGCRYDESLGEVKYSLPREEREATKPQNRNYTVAMEYIKVVLKELSTFLFFLFLNRAVNPPPFVRRFPHGRIIDEPIGHITSTNPTISLTSIKRT